MNQIRPSIDALSGMVELILERSAMGFDVYEIAEFLQDDSEILGETFSDEISRAAELRAVADAEAIIDRKLYEIRSELEGEYRQEIQELQDELDDRQRIIESEYKAIRAKLDIEYQDKLAVKSVELEEELIRQSTIDYEGLISDFLEDNDEHNPAYESYKVPHLVSFCKNLVFQKLMESEEFQKGFLSEMISDTKRLLMSDSLTTASNHRFKAAISEILIEQLKADHELMEKFHKEIITEISKTMFNKS